MNLRLSLAASALALSACAPPSPLASDLDVLGMDPSFWAIQINNTTKIASVSVQGAADMDAGYPVESKGAQNGAIVLSSQSPAGEVVITLTPSGKCRDGMSDRQYPWSANLALKGQTFKGCAGPKLAPTG